MSLSCLVRETHVKLAHRQLSGDGTVKFTFIDHQGHTFETCLLDLGYRTVPRVVCISTQVGCPFDCRFCAIGRDPFVRNLSCDELSYQILSAMDYSHWAEGHQTFEVAAMGTGEPLCALEELVSAVRSAKEDFPELVSLNVSTIGIPERIRQYSQTDIQGVDLSLQLSLHGASDEQRTFIMPIASRFSLSTVLRACKEFAITHKKAVLANYLLVEGVNDRCEDAIQLCKLLDPCFFSIKLSILNPTETAQLVGSNAAAISKFQTTLQNNGFQARVFTSCGRDIGAGCGQFSNSPA